MSRRNAILATALGLACLTVQAGSIWDKANAKARPIYSDDTARKVGDVLTIVIEERSVIENETERNLNKSTSGSTQSGGTYNPADLLTVMGVKDHPIFDFPKWNASTEAKEKFDGKADYDSDRKVTDQMTVTVQDIQPNGNLVVVGTRERTTAGDKQIVRVSGIVRPSDISFSNTVRSDRVAQFRVCYDDPPTEANFTKPGWLSRIWNYLNPY